MMVQALAVDYHIALAPVLIRGAGYRLCARGRGAGLASSVAVAIAVLMLWTYFHKLERYVGFDPAQLRPQTAVGRSSSRSAGRGEFAIVFIWDGVIY